MLIKLIARLDGFSLWGEAGRPVRAFPGFFYISGIFSSSCLACSASFHSLIVVYWVGGVIPSSISCTSHPRRCSLFFIFNTSMLLYH